MFCLATQPATKLNLFSGNEAELESGQRWPQRDNIIYIVNNEIPLQKMH